MYRYQNMLLEIKLLNPKHCGKTCLHQQFKEKFAGHNLRRFTPDVTTVELRILSSVITIGVHKIFKITAMMPAQIFGKRDSICNNGSKNVNKQTTEQE